MKIYVGNTRYKILDVNGRRMKIADKSYDAEIEYLESTGTQYIDTGIEATSNLSVNTKLANHATTWTNVNVMGAININTERRHHMVFDANGVGYYFGITRYSSNYKPENDVPFVAVLDAVEKKCTINNYNTTLPSITFSTGLNYYLFARNGILQNGKIRIYYAKLYNGTTLVRDFIPVKKNSIGYMYDKVSGQLFGNSGSGSFILGPDKKLPSGYTEVEYIKSNGAGYFNTRYLPTIGTDIEIDFKFNELGSAYTLSGCYDGSRRLYMGRYVYDAGRTAIRIGYGSEVLTNINADLNRHTYKYLIRNDYCDFYIDDSYITRVNGSLPTSYPLGIFANNNQNNFTTYNLDCTLYSYKITKDGNKIMELVPCIDSNNNVGVYDLVHETFDSGIGTFTPGNPV